MNKNLTYYLLTIGIALVWHINGLLCKLMGLVPRHQEIVAAILGTYYAPLFTKIIGLSEVLLGIWIARGKYQRITGLFQIVIILTMNVLEFTFVPHLLLWGKLNILFAIAFCLVIFYHSFWLTKPNKHASVS